MINKSIIISAIAAITIMESIALLKGFNGLLLTSAVGVVAALAGWVSPQLKIK